MGGGLARFAPSWSSPWQRRGDAIRWKVLRSETRRQHSQRRSAQMLVPSWQGAGPA